MPVLSDKLDEVTGAIGGVPPVMSSTMVSVGEALTLQTTIVDLTLQGPVLEETVPIPQNTLPPTTEATQSSNPSEHSLR
jgi:hypothetical protein